MSTFGVTPLAKWARQHARIHNEYVNGFIGEFFGTGMLCWFAAGAGATGSIFGGGHLMGTFGGVFGIMTAVTVVGGLSGAHLNSAVTLGLAIVGEISWIKVPIYWSGQLLGAYTGAGIGYGLYASLMRTELEKNGTISDVKYYRAIAGIFSPLPSEAPFWTCFADQVVTTAVLLTAVMAAVDRRNMKVPTHFFGIFFALVVAGIAFTFGQNAGGSMNPARDLGPRLMAITIGCDFNQVFKNQDGHYWLAILFGPFVGATIGSFAYVFLVGSNLKDTEEEEKEKALLGPNDNGDWRSTVFLPKANQPSVPQSTGGGPYGSGAPYTNGGPIQNGGPMNNNATGPYGGGIQNPGYIRDEPRQRQY